MTNLNELVQNIISVFKAILIDVDKNTESLQFSELDLIKLLNSKGIFHYHENDTLRLFKQHFLVMHSLHTISEALQAQKLGYLSISPSKIHFVSFNENISGTNTLSQCDQDSEVKSYYLNLKNIDKETENSIDAMLSAFWKKYDKYTQLNKMDEQDALDVFGLTHASSKSDLRKRYKEMAQRCHPDRGGDPNAFIRLREAYEFALTLVK